MKNIIFLIFTVVFILVGLIILYCITKKIKTTVDTLEKEKRQLNLVQQKQQKAIIETQDLIKQKDFLNQQISDIIQNQKTLNDNFETSKNNLNQSLKDYEDSLKKETQKQIDLYNTEYIKTIEDYVKEFNLENEKRIEQTNKLQYKLQDLQKTVRLAVEANIRILKKKEQEKFYQLNIPNEDLDEIKELRKAGKVLRNPEPLNKVIWKVYYEKPTTDLIGRVIGDRSITGIYKITNLQNGMTYVGQCLNMASRWKQHIKRGLGAETATKNKLYPAMQEYGVENFSFELIEECTLEELNEKEQKWQEYFMSKSFGYSIK